jgi:hypothetical protein
VPRSFDLWMWDGWAMTDDDRKHLSDLAEPQEVLDN